MMDERRKVISILTIKKFCDGLEMSLADFFHDEIFEELEPKIKSNDLVVLFDKIRNQCYNLIEKLLPIDGQPE